MSTPRRPSENDPRRILITGASGALGGALAQVYAAPHRELILHGRRQDALDTVAAACRRLGAEVTTATVDLTDTTELFPWLDALCEPAAPDLVILNAGQNTNVGPKGQGEPWSEVAELITINIQVPLAMLNHLGPRMRERGRGQLAIISSLAAYHGLPVTPSYSATKAALKAHGEALRGWLAPYGVAVNVIMPGYITSPMAEAMPGPQPFRQSPAQAAGKIQKGLQRNRPRISFPFPLAFACWSLGVLPPRIAQRLIRWFGYRAPGPC